MTLKGWETLLQAFLRPVTRYVSFSFFAPFAVLMSYLEKKPKLRILFFTSTKKGCENLKTAKYVQIMHSMKISKFIILCGYRAFTLRFFWF